jgi:Short C-terminal domain
MQELSSEGRRIVDDLARRHGVSSDAVAALLCALERGGGVQAQFNHPDLGGMGQWSQGGMIMIGDMFNQGLKFRVDGLCRELASLLRSQPQLNQPYASQSQSQSQGGGAAGVSLFVPGSGSAPGQGWPAELGSPASAGSQNDLHYAFFPAARRLAIRQGGRLSIYDTGDHQITGFSQQQSGDQSLTFTSQLGLVRVADLPLVVAGSPGESSHAAARSPESASPVQPPAAAEAPVEPAPPPQTPAAAPAPVEPAPPQTAAAGAPQGPAPSGDILSMIERLSDLRQKNILTDAEFAAKKAELLSRL